MSPTAFSGRCTFFTDGSASPPEYASVRISTWSVVLATPGESVFHKVLAGLTPGMVHTIARAETDAVLQAVKLSPACDLYVDNQGVCINLQRINHSGYAPLEWKSQVNGDLRMEISQVVASKPAGAIRIFKVKSHRAPHEARDPTDLWTILRKDAADKAAKEELAAHIQHNQWSTTRYKEYDQYIRDAILCSDFLHEVSKLVFKEGKPKEREVPQADGGDENPEGWRDQVCLFANRDCRSSTVENVGPEVVTTGPALFQTTDMARHRTAATDST